MPLSVTRPKSRPPTELVEAMGLDTAARRRYASASRLLQQTAVSSSASRLQAQRRASAARSRAELRQLHPGSISKAKLREVPMATEHEVAEIACRLNAGVAFLFPEGRGQSIFFKLFRQMDRCRVLMPTHTHTVTSPPHGQVSLRCRIHRIARTLHAHCICMHTASVRAACALHVHCIRTACALHAHASFKRCRHMSSDDSGLVSYHELLKMVRDQLHLDARQISDGEIQGLWRALDADESGSIAAGQFIKMMHPRHGQRRRPGRAAEPAELAELREPTLQPDDRGCNPMS